MQQREPHQDRDVIAAWPPADLSDIVSNTAAFDSDWYASSFPDVARSGLAPVRHYVSYGKWLERGISAAQPRGTDVPMLLRALKARRTISYCIPIMNRPEDIRATLKYNLDENRPLSDHIEFVILFFDQDHETHDWIRRTFALDLQTGYLRLVVEPPLLFWHFGRAKNAFKGRITGDVYCSLDGDNFVTCHETQQVLDVRSAHGGAFVFHQFSGDWGDGTSGRVCVPRHLYETVGYDEQLLPRQFDEIDLLITTLVRRPSTRYLRYDTVNHIFSSQRCAVFAAKRPRLPVKAVVLPKVKRHAPLNPRGATYLTEDALLNAMLAFNQTVCFWKNAVDKERPKFAADVFRARHAVIDAMPRDKLLPMIVAPVGGTTLPKVRQGEISLFASVKNDDVLLPLFRQHYRKLGVRHFFLVDDSSTTPVRDVLPYKDVHVFKPQTGNFATAKGMWLEALMKAFLTPGMWGITADADEFIDLPAGFSDIAAVAAAAEQDGRDYVPGLLLDMVPSVAAETLLGQDFAVVVEQFGDHAFATQPVSPDYAGHSSVKWGFAHHARLSWALDARYHAFATFDSLRKLPLIRYRPGLHLNQGFHDLHFTDGTKSPGIGVWDSKTVLPIRHFKLAKIIDEALLTQTSAYGKSTDYHHRTTANIAAIFGKGQKHALAALAGLPRRKYDAAGFGALIRELQQTVP